MQGNWKSLFRSFSASQHLSRRLLGWILICCTLLALLSTLFDLGWSFRQGMIDTRNQIDTIKNSYITPISASVWNMDTEQLNLQMKGLESLPSVVSATVYEKIDSHLLERMHVGDPNATHTQTEHLVLRFDDYEVGELVVNLTLAPVYQQLWQQGLVIFTTQALQTLCTGLLILLVFWLLFIRHLHDLNRWIRSLELTKKSELFSLHRSKPKQPDELDVLVDGVNQIHQQHAVLCETQKQLVQELEQEHSRNLLLSEQLEQKVSERTRTLEKSHAELQQAYTQLNETQESLLQSERTATLGALVSGMTQELSKPIMASLDSLSELANESTYLTDPSEHDVSVNHALQLARSELHKALEYLHHFQQIANIHHQQHESTFNVAEVLHHTIVSFGDRLVKQPCHIDVQCDPRLFITCDDAALNRILYQLIKNSLDHAFLSPSFDNKITIKIDALAERLRIDYLDNGVGIEPAIVPHFFEPFIQRENEYSSQKSTGLGGYIIYNQVVQLLHGQIKCLSKGANGVHFSIDIPIKKAIAA